MYWHSKIVSQNRYCWLTYFLQHMLQWRHIIDVVCQKIIDVESTFSGIEYTTNW